MKCTSSRCNNKRHLIKGLCRSCYGKKWRRKNGQRNEDYRRTADNLIYRIHSRMRDRVLGKYCSTPKLFKGLAVVAFPKFKAWAKSDPQFLKLFNEYIGSNRNIKLAPVAYRLNPDLGYTIGNMEWVTFSESSRRAITARRRFSK